LLRGGVESKTLSEGSSVYKQNRTVKSKGKKKAELTRPQNPKERNGKKKGKGRKVSQKKFGGMARRARYKGGGWGTTSNPSKERKGVTPYNNRKWKTKTGGRGGRGKERDLGYQQGGNGVKEGRSRDDHQAFRNTQPQRSKDGQKRGGGY